MNCYTFLILWQSQVCIVYLWTAGFISLFMCVLSIIGLCYSPDMGSNVPKGKYKKKPKTLLLFWQT